MIMLIKRGFPICNVFSLIERNRRGQIWVETVVYTLVAFALIGLVLAFVKPKIEEIQDKGIIEQSVNVLDEVDSIIRNIGGPGNQRVVRIGISKGTLNLDGVNDRIFFDIDSNHAYSEPGENIERGSISLTTQEVGSGYNVSIILDYDGEYNLKIDNADELKKIERGSTPYKVLISNEGVAEGETIIGISVE